MKLSPCRIVVIVGSVILLLASRSRAQATYSESFDSVGLVQSGQDGPSGLISRGWIFRNQSDARVSTYWRPGDVFGDGISPNEGAGFLASNADWDAGNRNISTWAILPPIPSIRAGDVVSYFITGWAYNDNRVQLRYSPSGGTSTGSGYNDVGDFTTLVNETGVEPVTFRGWQHVSAPAPGTGRLAIRWYNPQVMTAQSPMIAVDTLTITATAIDPPIPGPGQTVTWRLADSPISDSVQHVDPRRRNCQRRAGRHHPDVAGGDADRVGLAARGGDQRSADHGFCTHGLPPGDCR